jgi:dihydrofolate synthase / folylpolyglutamate synthase
VKISVTAIPTAIFDKKQDLVTFIKTHVKNVELEGKILAITTKIVSVFEDCLVAKTEMSKEALIRQEADSYLTAGGHGSHLTIKQGILIPSAGIDESNSAEGKYILYPKKPFLTAQKVWQTLRADQGVKNLGIILTDSHSTPLRRGVTGISLAHWGFKATNSFIGKQDLFGKPLQFTHVDTVDALATMAVLAMGEADEACPLAIIEGGRIEFTDRDCSSADIVIEPENDLYYPLLKPFL